MEEAIEVRRDDAPILILAVIGKRLANEKTRIVDQRVHAAKPVNRLIESLTNSRFAITGKSTFKDEFVTCGGIDPATLNLQTLESRNQPGLFFAGEVLNIDGITGGFNFQNAWTTGYIAGKNLGV